MNRGITVLCFFIAVLFFTVGCSGESDIIEIKEKLFVGQVNDIYLNVGHYLGKKINLEGIFKKGQMEEHGESFYFVLRYGPGCCGNDGEVGFVVRWSETQDYPEPESWVEAVGVLKSYRVNEYNSYLYLDLISLNVLNRRGAEVVSQ